MKQCPKCKKQYPNADFAFCLTDGAELLEVKFFQESEIQELEKKSGLNFLYGIIAAMAGIIAILTVIVFYSSSMPENKSLTETKVKDLSELSQNRNGNVSAPTPRETPFSTTQEKATILEIPKEITYKVVGVANNDVLWIRPSAGKLDVSVGSIPPNATGITAFGNVIKIKKQVWVNVKYKETTGWVNGRYLAKQ